MILYIFSMLWALLALLVFLYVIQSPQKFERLPSPILLLVSISLFFRLIPAFFLAPGSNFDIESYRLVGQHVVAGEDVYSAEDTLKRYPYLPFQMYWSALSHLISERIPLSFESVVRLAPILADLLICLLIYYWSANQNRQEPALWAGLLYALNPLSIYVSAYHGQFDAIPVVMIILAFIYAEKNRAGISGLWLGLGVLTKSWPVLALLLGGIYFRTKWQKLIFLIMFGIVPLAGVLIYAFSYHANILTVIKRATTYDSGIGVWGYTYLLRLLGLASVSFQQFYNEYYGISKYVTLLIIFMVWLLIARKQGLFAGMLTILLAFLAFTHAFSIQYLIWLLPFAILDQQFRWLKWYTLAAFSYMFLTYHTLILRMTINQLIPWPQADLALIIPTGLAAWLVVLAWFIERRKGYFRISSIVRFFLI